MFASRYRSILPVLDPSRKEIFVSPDGRNNGDGTINRPFQSIAYAIDYAHNAQIKTITLRGGTYRVTNPIVTKPGQTIRAYFKETPVISGGVIVTGWQVHSGDIIKAPRTHAYRQLYVNGSKAVLNRSTPYYKTLHWWDVEGISFEETARTTGRVIAINKTDYEAAGSPGVGTIFVLQRDWSDNYLPVHSVTVTGSKAFVKFTAEAEKACFDSPYPYKHAPFSYHFENVPTNLAEGAWYYDTNWVYYRLKAGELLSTINAVAPLANTLVNIESNQVTFEGIEFCHSNWFFQKGKLTFQGDSQIYLDDSDPSIPAAIEAKYASGITFVRCRFTQLGGNGIRLGAGTDGATIRGNVFNNIAGGPIVMHGPRAKTPQQSAQPGAVPIYLTDYVRIPATVDECKNHTIVNNYFNNFANEYYGCCGIFGSYIKGCNIVNNWLNDPPYTGISVGWGWSNAVSGCSNVNIQYNRINRPVWLMSDGAAIYLLGYAAGTNVERNHATQIEGNSTAFRKVNFVVYIDTGGFGITVNHNSYSALSPINGTSGVSGGTEDLIAPELNKGLTDNSVVVPVGEGSPNHAGIVAAAGIESHWGILRS